jgi:hypothetical protein
VRSSALHQRHSIVPQRSQISVHGRWIRTGCSLDDTNKTIKTNEPK